MVKVKCVRDGITTLSINDTIVATIMAIPILKYRLKMFDKYDSAIAFSTLLTLSRTSFNTSTSIPSPLLDTCNQRLTDF